MGASDHEDPALTQLEDYIRLLESPFCRSSASSLSFTTTSKTMHWSIAVLSYLAGSAFAQNSSSGGNTTAPNLGPNVLTSDMVSSMGNNTLFNRWRPTYHFISPAGWMNVSAWSCSRLATFSLHISGPMWYDVRYFYRHLPSPLPVPS